MEMNNGQGIAMPGTGPTIPAPTGPAPIPGTSEPGQVAPPPWQPATPMPWPATPPPWPPATPPPWPPATPPQRPTATPPLWPPPAVSVPNIATSQPPRFADSMFPKTTVAELLFALALIFFGFFYWDWQVGWLSGAGFGTTVFFIGVIVMSFAYLIHRGVQQNTQSWVLLLVAVAGSLPFALNGPREINPPLILFEIAACLLWFMYSCRCSLSERLSGLLLGDLFNQHIIVPFGNFSRLFTRPLQLLRGDKKKWASILFACLGFFICIPIFALVIMLLSDADTGFRYFFDNITQLFRKFDIVTYTLELALGIPVAAFIFGSVFGNVFKRHTAHLKADRLMYGFQKAHVLPHAALIFPLALFVLLYIVFFITMGSYLFSGLQGQLPVTYTYAEYARRGFFELCAVATINLMILGFVWLLAKRGPSEYPLVLRILSGLLAFLTCLLVITAMSKMLLYIQTYNLSPLRVYTFWFMVLMLLVFLLLVAWHIKPFNATRPIIVLIMVFTLGIGLTNTNGIIANYNVDRYLAGQTDKVDVAMLYRLGDPAVPALYKLEQGAHDSSVRDEAANATRTVRKDHNTFSQFNDHGLTTLFGWQDRNLQSLKIDWLYLRS